jgi:hypothetical protein
MAGAANCSGRFAVGTVTIQGSGGMFPDWKTCRPSCGSVTLSFPRRQNAQI